jgi:hypothetical protein
MHSRAFSGTLARDLRPLKLSSEHKKRLTQDEVKIIEEYVRELYPSHGTISTAAPGSLALYDAGWAKSLVPITSPIYAFDTYAAYKARRAGYRVMMRIDITTEHYMHPTFWVGWHGNAQKRYRRRTDPFPAWGL